MIVSLNSWLSTTGWTKHRFELSLVAGFPVKKRPVRQGEGYEIDTVAGIAWIVEQAVGPRDPATLDLNAERARLANEQANKLERERLVEQGRLLDAGKVRAAWLRGFAAINTKLGALPSTLAHVIRPDDPKKARRHLEVAVEQMRAELRAIDLSAAGSGPGQAVEGTEGGRRH